MLKVLSDPPPFPTSPCTINFIFGVLSRGRRARRDDRKRAPEAPEAPGPGWELICLTRSLTTDLPGFPSAGCCHSPAHLRAQELACFRRSGESGGPEVPGMLPPRLAYDGYRPASLHDYNPQPFPKPALEESGSVASVSEFPPRASQMLLAPGRRLAHYPRSRKLIKVMIE